ncbi:MAG: hypothetical protein WAN36_06070, partial [Calditrichia bacterium]
MKAHFLFFFRNYIRSHRYIRELIFITLFNIIFSGFLYGTETDEGIWLVFGVFTLLLNMITAPSVFFLEKSTARLFPLIRPKGRRNFLIAKILLIFCIDFFWIALFTLLYGIRFLEAGYFLLLPLRWLLLGIMQCLSILILSLSFTYRAHFAWVILILFVFGSILNKAALFPIEAASQIYHLLSFLLPPFFELIYSTVTLEISAWRLLFILAALV